jgi:hypothetical protein
VREPTLIEELLQYNNIRKIKCQEDKTSILVDEPNTLLVFTKRAKVQRSRVEEAPDENEGEANIDDSPQQNFSPSQVDERP